VSLTIIVNNGKKTKNKKQKKYVKRNDYECSDLKGPNILKDLNAED